MKNFALSLLSRGQHFAFLGAFARADINARIRDEGTKNSQVIKLVQTLLMFMGRG